VAVIQAIQAVNSLIYALGLDSGTLPQRTQLLNFASGSPLEWLTAANIFRSSGWWPGALLVVTPY
jgi:hypothetical protein